MLRAISHFRLQQSPSCTLRGWQACYATQQGKKLSPTVTQGVLEDDAPQPVGQPKDVPAQSHPYRNMEVETTVPNEMTAERVPDQVPDMPGGKGKYPDPLASDMARQMVPGESGGPDTRSDRAAGTRVEMDALPGDPKENKVDR